MTGSDPAETPLAYLLTDGGLTSENFTEKAPHTIRTIDLAAAAGISLIQIREKSISAKLLFELSHAAAAIIRNTGTRLLVNDRADVAVAAGADGVHLTEASLPTSVIRAQFPKTLILGVSTHSIEGTLAAAADGADFALFGPVFTTPGKGEPQGLEKLSDAVKAVPGLPVLAIGGIDESNYPRVLECGAGGFAAIRFLNDAGNLRRLSGRFRKWKT